MTRRGPARCATEPCVRRRHPLGPSPHGRPPPCALRSIAQVRPRGTHHRPPPRGPLDTATAALTLTLSIALIGALIGAAGFAAFVVSLQNRRIARIAERLARADADNPVLAAEAARIRDPRLRGAFEELAGRVAQTWVQATVDPLTGIANRQAVLSRVEEELARASRYRRPLSLILVDLDHFKRCNDSYGHTAGDAILRHVAQLT